jgi:hypothetical protein
MKILSFLILLIIIVTSCDDDSNLIHDEEAFVIGFDPCTGIGDPNAGKVGFLIRIASLDTVVAHNFTAGVYEFPPEYFVNYRHHVFFPDSALEDFPLTMNYRYAKPNEKVYPICRHDIVTGWFDLENQIIIHSVTK